MHHLHLLFMFLVLVKPAGAQRDAIITQPDRPFRIVVIGSSTAAGAGARPIDSSWVNRYEHYLKLLFPPNQVQVINLAKRGTRSHQLLPTGYNIPPDRPTPDTLRNITHALILKPDAIIIALPSNDIAAGYSVEETLANFDIMANLAQEQGVPVWFATTQPRNFAVEKISAQFMFRDSILKRYPHRSINFWQGLATPDGRLKPRYDGGDGIHLNNAGHRLLFERIRANSITKRALARQRQLNTNARVWSEAVPLNVHGNRLPPPKPGRNAASGNGKQPKNSKQETILLQTGKPMKGVTVEIYNASGKLLRKRVCDLPIVIKADFGPKGTYWIKIKGPSFQQTRRWVKNN